MNYETKKRILVAISVVTALVSVVGLSIVTSKMTGQWFSFVFFIFGYSMFWWGMIDSRIGKMESSYERLFSRIGQKRYLTLVAASLLIGILIASGNKITSLICITLAHVITTGVIITAYEFLTEYIEKIPENKTWTN